MDREAEEEEAIAIQNKMAAELDDDDFGLDIFEVNYVFLYICDLIIIIYYSKYIMCYCTNLLGGIV